MPTYKFFEATKAQTAKEPKFEQFNLSTIKRSMSRTRKSLPVEDEAESSPYVFKAAKMPDFSDTFNGVKPPSPKKLTNFVPFKLNTTDRGEGKQSKLDFVVQKEQEMAKEGFCFKATPVKMNKAVVIPDRVRSDRKTTKAVNMRLVSNDRSMQRELFDQAIKEKEMIQAEQKAQQEEERLRLEEEEVRKIRAASNFKATPIKKYRNTLG